MQVYFNKIQNTNDKSITKFYYNKNDKLFNNLEFLQNKIKSLLTSEKTTESVKKQLKRLVNFDFTKYDCFYIYSNNLCFGINLTDKIIDFYKNDFDSVINLSDFTKNYNCKIESQNKTTESVNDSDFN